ncbi:MAG: 16S rRNA (guanine(966)-N(2))-methyltransferase RsmD [Alphaproteobacteria bacterium]
MRIIGGVHRGRALVAPDGGATRPTSERVREALFNILSHGIPHARETALPQGARVLDLFAGSGALGLEALSRGALRVLFVDNAPAARAAIRENIETLQAAGAAKLYRRDAGNLGPMESNCGGPFDLAFLDPPYHSGLIHPALEGLREGGWLNPQAVLVIELASNELLPEHPGYTELDRRVYGDTMLVFLKRD